MKKVLQYGFLDNKKDQLWQNVILVGTRADSVFKFKETKRSKKFEQVAAAFYSDLRGSSDGEGEGAGSSDLGAVAYTYYHNGEQEEEEEPCKSICIDDLMAKIKATPSWSAQARIRRFYPAGLGKTRSIPAY